MEKMIDLKIMVNCFIEALESSEKDIRDTAMQVLVQMGGPAIPILVKNLQAANSEVRMCIADVLTQLHWKPTNDIEYAFYAYASQRWDVMVEIGLPSIYACAAAIQDESFYIRTSAVLALGEIAHPEVLPLLELAIQDENSYVRSAAVRSLSKLSYSALHTLTRALYDEDKGVRQEAAAAMVNLGEIAVPALITALRESDWYSRGEVMYALTKIGRPAVPELVNLLGDNDLCHEAANILTNLKVDPAKYGFNLWA